MESPTKPKDPPQLTFGETHRQMDICLLWSLAIFGAISLTSGVGLYAAAPSDWTFSQKLGIAYWATLGTLRWIAKFTESTGTRQAAAQILALQGYQPIVDDNDGPLN